MASFILAPAALLNKSEWLASVLSHTYPYSPPPPSSLTHKRVRAPRLTRRMCGVNPNRGAMVTVRGAAGRGSVSLWGVSEGVQRAHTQKNKADGSRNYPTHGLHLFPPHTPPSAPIQPVFKKPSGGLEVEECLNAGLVHAASDHKVPADSSAGLLVLLTHFHKQAMVYGCFTPKVWRQKTRMRK